MALNTHLDHTEDVLFLHGVDGLRDSINFLRSTRDMLASGTKSKNYDLSVKFDGAPAIFCGKNPENGKFFVGTKSIFNKKPKINYTLDDIDKNHGHAPNLSYNLKQALKYLPELGIKNILQGDVMFSKDDLSYDTIDGDQYLIFQPNTIVYAIPVDSELADTIKKAQMGIVFHTTYSGDSMDQLTASFGVDLSSLNASDNVWYQNAEYKDFSGTVSMTKAETDKVTALLSKIGKNFNNIDSRLFTEISLDNSPNKLKQSITGYINSIIRTGSNRAPTKNGLISFVNSWWDKEIQKVKTDTAKSKKLASKRETIRYINSNAEQFDIAFAIHQDLMKAKNHLIKKLEIAEGMSKTFVKDSSGYKVVAPEGFVAISKEKGNAVKLVNRLEFSANNFNPELKNWK
jgi:hypothetical protein